MQNTPTVEGELRIGEAFNLFKTLSTKENIDNPYPIYHQLRSFDPVYFMKSPTGFLSESLWILTGYEDISYVLTDKQFGRGNKFGKAKIPAQNYAKLNSLTQMRQHWITFLDPPDHTRIRNLINKSFSPKMVNNLKPTIKSVSNYLIDNFSGGQFEVLSQFSYPLATIVIAELFGIPREDRDLINKWASQLVKTLDVVTYPFTNEELQNLYKSADEIKEYFRKVVDEKIANPKEDLISKLVTVKDKDDQMTKEEVISSLVLLIMDAHETTKNLVANGMYALLQNPEQMELLREKPVLIENAVEEFLRYDSPAQFTGRRTHEDTEIRGKEIKKGIQLICMLGAGNRDPAEFENPDDLNIERKNIRPLSFGAGIHYCVGSGLSRLESQIAINLLLERFRNLDLKNEQYHYQESLHARGLQSLEVTIT